MDNNVSHSHSSENAAKNIGVVFWLNAFFVVVEVIGGFLTNSIAILSDALHDFGDCLSLAIAYGLQKKSERKRDRFYSYGYKRFSLLGTVFLSGVLTVSSIFVIIEAVKRIVAPQEVSADGMLWLAIAGIFINGAAALRLHKGSSLNERAVFLHIMEDVLGWVAVLIVSIVMLFIKWPILDPILSVCISIWVLSNVYGNLKKTFRILLQAIPDGVNVEELKQRIEVLPGINSVHDLHVWSLDGESHVMTLHVVTESDSEELRHRIYLIGQEYNITHTTIECELPGSKCDCDCDVDDHCIEDADKEENAGAHRGLI